MIFDKVKEILMDQLDVEEEKVTMEASIVEEEFDVEIPDDQVENIKTVGDIVKYIEDNAQ